MEKTWTITTLEDGKPVGTYTLSREEAFRALRWKLLGGSLEERLGAAQPVAGTAASNGRGELAAAA